MAQHGIHHIAADSAEARGRSERTFRTLQDRLPKEPALAGIATLEAANRWIAETYLAAHDTPFRGGAGAGRNRFRRRSRRGRARDPVPAKRAPGRQRQHGQMARSQSANPAKPIAPPFVRATVRIHEYPDGRLAIFHGPHRLVEYDNHRKRTDDAKLAA